MIGSPVTRLEDERLLTGKGTYVDDIQLPEMLHAAILRSPHAHARIRSIDAEAARALPGVAAVYTYDDLPDRLKPPTPLLIPNKALISPRTQYALANGIVRHVGEAVAMVVAVDRYVAEDALDLIKVEYQALPAVTNIEEAVKPGSPLVHEDAPGNIVGHLVQSTGDFETACAGADLVFEDRYVLHRSAGMPMETRGGVAHLDPREDLLTVWLSTQAPIRVRNGISQVLGIPEHKIRVVAPHVGGGFGTKILIFYPEEFLIPMAAVQLGRPVKWIEDRREHLLASAHERTQIHDVKVAVAKDGTILGLKDIFLHEDGAYSPYGLIVPIVASTSLPGTYKLGSYHAEFRSVYTNKMIVSPYRGAGRPHGVFVMERVICRIAKELGLDPNDVRLKNCIAPEEMPYDMGLIYQDGGPVRYDSGQYAHCLNLAMEALNYEEFRAEQARLQAEGRYVGVGIGPYVEGSAVGPYEGARVKVDPSGRVFVATGVGTQGQSHYTVFAQIAAEQLTVPLETIEVVTGDTQAFGWGTGTFASRAAVVAGNAIHAAASALRRKALQVGATLLEASEVELIDGRVRVKGNPDRSVSLGEIAAIANPIRGILPENFEPGLEATRYYNPKQAAFANGVHGCIVEVDAETGFFTFKKYVVVHDCGKVINPMVVDGQIIGGIAQGVGGSFYEKLEYDENGQLLNTTFMDFLIPTAMEVPHVDRIIHVESPSPLNELGAKGAGEAGVIPVAAMVAEALEDALKPFGVTIKEMPLSPDKLRRLIQNN